MNTTKVSRPIYIPHKRNGFALLQSYVTYSEENMIYHFEGKQYVLTFPRKVIKIYPLNVPFSLEYVVMIFWNGISINHLNLKEGTLNNTTIYSISTIVESVQDYFSIVRGGMSKFVVLYNQKKVISVEVAPLKLQGGTPVSTSEFMIENKKEIFKGNIIELEEEFTCITMGKKIYLGGKGGIFEVNGKEIKNISKEIPIRIVSGKENITKDINDQIGILTKNQIIYGDVTQVGFKEREKKEIEKSIKHISTGCYENVMMIGCGFSDKTIIYEYGKEIKEKEFKKGKSNIGKYFGIIEDIVVIITNDIKEGWIEEIGIEKEEGMELALIPQSDKKIGNENEEKRKMNEIIKKQKGYIEKENQKANEYIKEYKEEYEEMNNKNKEKGKIRKENNKNYLEERKIEENNQNEKINIPLIDSTYYDIFSSYVKEYEELSIMLNELNGLLKTIDELIGNSDKSITEYNSLLEILEK
ncbi:hypothetical protein EDI_088540 [Entamoeba dispar SAW760]|uniref:Uncharacterized protein n=1 Tax=Entamoeba dispar (strain ATCC PRA-260 / SAW760) TaxID=370354 RepID=B0E8Q8_ENTDS|nr:uncharacterized protein EDI_088540 [Entamoeba dispar SAW760]EDR29094.1 hypothetical protein EDI_088540 [Entamoeba dispar SAW760]|eukprot:EDR29094.1 hypothetical protein EDI_088540 [Entamoeba dispar SAW760]